ncbi:MAG: hypothetical protein MJ144_05750 [Clostridia bacterium]|nr:hypothetical protein [Clostridia bacterium]
MRLIRFLLSIILALVLIASAGAALSSFAVTEAVSEEAIHKAVVETGAVDELTDRILAQNTVNMGGQYGQTMKEILKSEAMTEFFTAYTAVCLQNQVRGEEGTAGSGYYNEIGSDDLFIAFSGGTDECINNGSISMGEGERKIFDAALKAAMPTLANGINYVIQQMNLTSFIDDDTAEYMETAQMMTSSEFRYGAIGIAAIACLGLILLRRHRRSGMFWCGICLLLIAGLFFVFATMLSGSAESSGNFVALSTRMLYVMVAYGLKKVATVGGAVGIACLPVCLVAKLVRR